jgi:hypothetical protein
MKKLVWSLSVVATNEELVVRREGEKSFEKHLLKELNCFHSIGRGKDTYTIIMHASLNPKP